MKCLPSPFLSRRTFFRHACCGACGGLAAFMLPALAAEGRRTTLSANEALARLKQGNADFLADRQAPEPPTRHHERRMEIARSQTPFAVLLGCSDSRVPPELLFGAGLGELFIVRNAGNTVDTVALGSIEYGVQVLGAPLVVVLGHERCGAVDAAMAVVQKNATFPGSIGPMVEPIIPAVLKARSAAGNEKLKDDELLDLSVRENVRRTVLRLRESEPSLIEPQRAGRLRVVGARYDLDDGKVDFFVE
ncbi:carbonic anhydrase [Azohydromonas caseinilytica]|uniref:carbonic anhydrase n=1 Tax=Azohydromonas caseinilytica TaxID=2728836 RepID=A0A848F9U6_9BURK|nr:carbonic anhydrase [Azohydromonas caseinilytica]NML15229.1 carbonic anhydrase [Azohydromonas caseinilytica]